RPDGTALILVPQDPERERTYEDPSITTPQDRLEHFWQADHLRLYGTDVAQRLEQDGFTVLVDRYARTLDPALIARHAMGSPGMYHPGLDVGAAEVRLDALDDLEAVG